MNHHFKNYYWKDGKPYGKDKIDPLRGISYKIVTDPYHKRYSVEKYADNQFRELIYDSNLFDFRHLKDPAQAAWLKEPLSPNESLIRNQEDRVILREKYEFENNFCRSCTLLTPQGLPVSQHKIFYEILNDTFNGVLLSDLNGRPVMRKTYKAVEGEFTELLTESWDFGLS
jgi:hypothetical protein